MDSYIVPFMLINRSLMVAALRTCVTYQSEPRP